MTFAKGEEVVIKGVRFVVACPVRRLGVLILKLKEDHVQDSVARREAQDRRP